MAIKPDKGSKFYWVACARAEKKYNFSTICTHPIVFQANKMGRQTKKSSLSRTKKQQKERRTAPPSAASRSGMRKANLASASTPRIGPQRSAINASKSDPPVYAHERTPFFSRAQAFFIVRWNLFCRDQKPPQRALRDEYLGFFQKQAN